MSLKEKMGEGIKAKGSFSFSGIREITQNIVQEMGEKAVVILDANQENGTIALGFFKTGVQKVMHFNIVDLADKSPDLLAAIEIISDGAVTVSIVDATTSQQKLYGLIPVSPKAVHGITTYRDFLDHFTDELLRIYPHAEVSRNESQNTISSASPEFTPVTPIPKTNAFVQDEATTGKYCTNCGTVLKKDGKFCPKCGNPIAQENKVVDAPTTSGFSECNPPAKIQHSASTASKMRNSSGEKLLKNAAVIWLVMTGLSLFHFLGFDHIFAGYFLLSIVSAPNFWFTELFLIGLVFNVVIGIVGSLVLKGNLTGGEGKRSTIIGVICIIWVAITFVFGITRMAEISALFGQRNIVVFAAILLGTATSAFVSILFIIGGKKVMAAAPMRHNCKS